MLKDEPFLVDIVRRDGYIELRKADESYMVAGMQWKKEWGPRPKKGTLFYLVTEGFGHLTQGIKRADKSWLKTPEDFERERDEYLAERKRKDRENLEKNRETWRAEIDALDPPFKARIERFIAQKGGFDEFFLDFGDYELFCVTQAQGLYSVWKTLGDDITWFNRHKDDSYESVKMFYPEVNDGHSGNTWGAMFALARAVAQGYDI